MQPEKQEKKTFTLDEALDIIRDRFTITKTNNS